MGEQDEEATPSRTLSPSAEFPPPGEEEREALRQAGRQWGAVLQGQTTPLPLDPDLGRYSGTPAPSRFARLAPVEMFRAEEPDQLVATESATVPQSRAGRVLTRARRLVLGPPLASAAVVQERMRKLVALPVLSSDLLSSVAYGPEAMLTVLVLAGTAALGLSLPIAGVLVVMMIAVGLSYRQTVTAYPHGAGSYLVASDNLGPRPALTAAAGLMVDYILTVSVSVASGIAAITSALPTLRPLTVPMGLAVIALLLAGNLRGIRAAGNLFAAPTYAFILAVVVLFGFGLAQAARRGFVPVPPPDVTATEGIGVLLVLRAFASGAVSMTGIEAVSNAVPIFRPSEWRNARTTLTWMIALLVVLFSGLTLLSHLYGVVPGPEETLLSQLADRTLPAPLYAYVQATTALVLLLAANTAFNDFPRLLYFVARDGYVPRIFLHMGDRLAFRNGIAALAVPAAVIFVAFHGVTESLIPLYAVGVFLAFTLSQTGMVIHWRRVRGAHWRRSMAINAFGAVLSGLVLIIAAVTKFHEGAWVVLVTVPLLILLFLRIRRHYDKVGAALSLRGPPRGSVQPVLPQRPAPAPPEPPAYPSDGAPAEPSRGRESDGEGQQEIEDTPQEVRHLVVVPVARLDLAALRALAYAASLGQPTFAVHISPEEEEADRFRQEWTDWGDHLRLEIIVSPYRAIIPLLAHYFEALHALRPDLAVTVIVPEVVVPHWWQRLLRSGTGRRLRVAVRQLPGVVITSVPIHVFRD
ncbi:APC family permease [Micromonospora sp. NPDC049679]|uniref:APC family permease n=1 Tax=Micromonospora sp. NPDC049679 TaxID=3155920 RepID=UPI0033CF71F0